MVEQGGATKQDPGSLCSRRSKVRLKNRDFGPEVSDNPGTDRKFWVK